MLPFKKILYPTDFSEASYEALKAANELALHFSTELYLVHVVSPNPIAEASTDFSGTADLSVLEEMETSAKNLLQGIVKQKVPKELHTHQIVVLGGAADEIIRIGEEEKVDLIVIATHGQTGWRHLVFGSVAERVVRLAPCPVLTIRAPHEESKKT
jgi:nucleotide-binding universal stress UspA family protein